MNAIQKMIFRNVQTVAETQMSKIWNANNSFLVDVPSDAAENMKLRSNIESNWNGISEIIYNNETPESILDAVNKFNFADDYGLVESSVRNQIKFAME